MINKHELTNPLPEEGHSLIISKQYMLHSSQKHANAQLLLMEKGPSLRPSAAWTLLPNPHQSEDQVRLCCRESDVGRRTTTTDFSKNNMILGAAFTLSGTLEPAMENSATADGDDVIPASSESILHTQQ